VVQVRLLGPLEVVAGDGTPLLVGGAKERAVLALLALHAGQVVAEGQLVDALWGDDPPRTATKTLRSYVSRLRQGLARGGDEVVIDTAGGGYRLQVGPDGLDVTRVEQLVAQARDAAGRGDHAWAAVALTEAARSWRGRPLGELGDEPWALADANRLAELRLAVLEERVEEPTRSGQGRVLRTMPPTERGGNDPNQ
jgi:DNA-binding SARP family transcriptional activator